MGYIGKNVHFNFNIDLCFLKNVYVKLYKLFFMIFIYKLLLSQLELFGSSNIRVLIFLI